MMRALVSIGTNSTRLLILDDGRRVASESRGTRLGSGIGESGTIAPEARRRTLSAVDAYVTIARRCGAEQIDAISTSVLRRARDGDAFGAVVARRVGIAPRILTGAE
jgi:exopolyphosphatase/guanosine-5'-triphosphate,3'-diphosphate pyrophosphatase